MIVAIASGKGGTGKTFVSTNLFQALQKSGKNVTIVDCDAEEPNVAEFISGHEISTKTVLQHIPEIDTKQCQFCGKCFEYCQYNAIVFLPMVNFIKVIEDLCHDCGACSYACQYGAISETEKPLGVIGTFRVNDHSSFIEARTNIGIPSSVPVIKKAIKETDGQHLVLLDSPPGISCPFIATVSFADYIVLVTEPTPFGLNDLKLSVETIQQMKKPFGVIINRAGLGDHAVYEWLEQNNIPLLMEIPFDVEIARIYSEGKLLVNEDKAYLEQFLNLYKTISHESFRQ
ncbi:MAG: ATP-binding protein [Bacteroidales bacterium]|nr:ATP-binding protein [Bacteroidales bacterium]